MVLYFDDNFAANGNLVPGRWAGLYSQMTIDGIRCITSNETFTGTSIFLLNPTVYTNSSFVIKVVGAKYGLASTTTQGNILLYLTNTSDEIIKIGYVDGNITVLDKYTQTNIGLGFVDSYSVSDLRQEGVTFTMQWTKYNDNSSGFVCSFYTDASLTTLIGTSTNDSVPAGILYGQLDIIVDNPDFNPTGTFVQRVAMYTADTSCFYQGSLIDTLGGPVPVEKLEAGMEVIDFIGEKSKVVKVWKTRGHKMEQCYIFGDVAVTDKHSIQTREGWIRISALSTKPSPRSSIGSFYQIQTNSFGVKSGTNVYSTWTQSHVESNLDEIRLYME